MKMKRVSGTEVAYKEIGAGEWVVLVHAGGNSSAQWRAVAAQLASRFRVVMPELHGHGDTARWPKTRPLELDDDATLVEGICEDAPGPVHLVGHSFGGAVALRAALRGRIRLASLLLIEPMMFPLLREAGREALWRQTWERRERFAKLHREGDDEAALRDWVEHYAEAKWETIPESRRRALIERADVVEAGWHALSNNPTTIDALRRLDTPTRVVVGDRTTASLAAASAVVTEAIPNAESVSLEGAAHMMPLSCPDGVAGAIAEFARRHGGALPISGQSPVEIHEYDVPGQTRRLGTCAIVEIRDRAPDHPRWIVRHPDGELTDAHLAPLVDALLSHDVPGLSLAGCALLCGPGLSQLGRLEQLRIVDLFRVPCGDHDLAGLAGLSRLASLDLSGTRITDGAVDTLRQLTGLEELHLGWTEIGDGCLAAIAELPSLRWLDVSGTRVTAAGLSCLARAPSLEHLALRELALADRDLAGLMGLKDRLRSLDVSYTGVGSGAVDDLACLRGLRRLVLRGTRLAASGDAHLVERLAERGDGEPGVVR